MLQKTDSHEIEIQMSPGAGNYGSTMFEDRHRESFVDENSVSPTAVYEDGQPSLDQANLDVDTGNIAIGDIHDDGELLQDPQANRSRPEEEQRESGADPSYDDEQD